MRTIDLLQEAEKALKYYKGCKGSTVAEANALSKELDRIKITANERQADKKWHFSDICKYPIQKYYRKKTLKNYKCPNIQMNAVR